MSDQMSIATDKLHWVVVVKILKKLVKKGYVVCEHSCTIESFSSEWMPTTKQSTTSTAGMCSSSTCNRLFETSNSIGQLYVHYFTYEPLGWST